ncbi:hypothetical protein ACN23B_16270 [Anabaena sp. FACHB-709]|uniref:Uncharacterized protein n=2 Tax=Nostocaceae TaxID=1162 RepID=A0A1Z4KJ19_ANAVA|nr:MULTISPECIES: hypothetical protein [Nostocaceae]BAY68863.1 hypothetical protein NIES23_16530 [Trichormus variabilis NIES-23]HBW31550.1 hypothetical protein [Nostoc sp. UBA8866]MBD2170441.1 hypothetical protein [Anabaena cylindrica FACHB-318]MBD2262083.1 hypothetical protein [Anabaena sp. FACHB-709]MBD2271773.1 hypothetical protein [Nostoc sp. PCC 7120 = FACHB-418]
MYPSPPALTPVHRLSRHQFIQCSSICLASSMIAACANSNQASTSNGQLDKITFGTNWLAQAKHRGFYQMIILRY